MADQSPLWTRSVFVGVYVEGTIIALVGLTVNVLLPWNGLAWSDSCHLVRTRTCSFAIVRILPTSYVSARARRTPSELLVRDVC